MSNIQPFASIIMPACNAEKYIGNTIESILNQTYEKIELIIVEAVGGIFNDFGWNLLNDLKETGFSDAYAMVHFSVQKGYFGEIPIFFETVK